MTAAGDNRDLFLVPVSGPPLDPLRLAAGGRGVTLGRHERCELRLPASSHRVSRQHARFDRRPDGWRVADLGSRWGTFVNGVALEAGREVPLREGDLVHVAPWTFAISTAPRRPGLDTADDAGRSVIQSHDGGRPAPPPPNDLLSLLLESAGSLHEARDEVELARRVMDAACRGTGLATAAVLRPVDAGGRVEVVAHNTGSPGFGYSRSLLAAAAQGRVAELSGGPGSGGSFSQAQSIMQMNISSALCVPLMLGQAPAAFLYLDSRGTAPRPLRHGAAEFCTGLGRIASLALANLKRLDIERRQASVEAELKAAAAAQRFVLPPRLVRVGPFTCAGESRPGRHVGGDFFDVIDLGDGRLGLALGDVAGKGVAAAVLMTATQGYLHATLRQGADPAAAVTALNSFVGPRATTGTFVTAWVGVFDPAARTLTYVDAGHGYALLRSADGSVAALDVDGGPPIGVVDGYAYQAAATPMGDAGQVLIVSDGFVEQPGRSAGSDPGAEPTQLGLDGVRRALVDARSAEDHVSALFRLVFAHAASKELADDATAVLAQW